MEQDNQEVSFGQRIQNWWKNLRQNNLRAQAHYAVFRATHNLKQRSDVFQRYKERLKTNWDQWLGVGAGLAGLLLLFNPEDLWRWQLVFLLLGLVLGPLLADFWDSLRRPFTEYPGKQYIGQALILDQPLVKGKGSIKLDNQVWQLSGQNCPAGSQVRVIAISDRTLYITLLNRAPEDTTIN